MALNFYQNQCVFFLFFFSLRSAVLLFIKRSHECLLDIGRALECDCPKSLQARLQYRMAECYERLSGDSYGEAKFWLGQMPLNDSSKDEYEGKLKNYTSKSSEPKHSIEAQETIVPVIQQPNERIPCISSAIDVKHSKKYGRHFVATRDIAVGEILIVEKPYSVSPSIDNCFSHCHHCLRIMWAGIPCEECINALYCSEECQKIGYEKHHHIECNFIDLFSQCRARNFQLAGSRLLIDLINEAGGLQQLKERFDDIQLTSGIA